MKKINLDFFKNIDLKNKKDLIKLSAIAVAVLLIIIVLIILLTGSKKMTCQLNKNLIDGFNNNEKVVFNIKDGKISKIEYDRKITINDYYKKYGTYINSLESILNTGYGYLKNKDISTTDSNVTINFKTDNSGVILNNLNIVYNNDTDDTSLRFDIKSDIENDENTYKVGDKYSKRELKKSIEKLGYKCK